MNTLGNVTKRKLVKGELNTLSHAFVADVDLKENQLVKLTSTGVAPLAATTDRPIGVVKVAAKQGDFSTIMTQFQYVLKSVLSGTVVVGDELAIETSVDGVDKFKVASTGDYVVGFALEAGVATDEIEAGILYQPYKK